VSARVVLSTCPDRETAEAIARELVEARLAACVNVLPRMRSIYQWEGAVVSADEVLLIAKTTPERTAALCARLVELHPYDMPEAIALDVADGTEMYLNWVEESVESEQT
jgi:periplasmic divalent cation tolerance protein